MKEVDECLGEIISVGEQRKFEALRCNADSVKVFVLAKEEEIQLLTNNFREYTEDVKNGYKSDSKTLRSLCLENATTKRTFHLDFNTLLEETEEYFG